MNEGIPKKVSEEIKSLDIQIHGKFDCQSSFIRLGHRATLEGTTLSDTEIKIKQCMDSRKLRPALVAPHGVGRFVINDIPSNLSLM